jgi:rod shape determining protein RodA
MFALGSTERQSRIDWLQLLGLAGLMIVGVLFIYSATHARALESLPWHKELFIRQMVWCGAGLGMAAIMCLVDYRSMSRWSMVAYWIMIVLLILVLIPGIGTMRGGARRWFDLQVFLFQPSEFAKLAFIFAFGHFLSRPVEELRSASVFFKALGLLGLPFVLIMKEPDLGSALIFIPTGFMMMLVSGVPRRFLVRLVGLVSVLAALFLVDILFAPPGWWTIKLEDYQRHRLLVYFGKDFAPANATKEEKARANRLQQEKSYQGRQALISVGTGGLTGRGWCEGNQTSLGFLPPGAAHTDFIFSVIAEEKGFMGSVIVIALYSVLLFTGVRIAGQARDRLGKLLAVGVVTMLFSHIFINIGMNIRLMPVTGVPLPLLSYGGSSVLCSLIAIGILQNVNLYRRSY